MKKYLFLFCLTIFFFIPGFVRAEGCNCFIVAGEGDVCEASAVNNVFQYETQIVLSDVVRTMSPAEGCTKEMLDKIALDTISIYAIQTPKKGEPNCNIDRELQKDNIKLLSMTCSHSEEAPDYVESSGTTSSSTPTNKPAEREYVEIPNPLKGNYSIQQLMGLIVNRFMGVLGSITLVVFVYGGFMFLTAAGNDEKVKKGTNAMLYAAIGLFIIFGAYVILNMVLGQVLGV
ncbi:MAG: pilin [Candidatus Magasanikbacteria bacterium]